jgi:hypothetical protein
VIKYFGKQLEEFRREQGYCKEVVLSDLSRQQVPDQMAKHAEGLNDKGIKSRKVKINFQPITTDFA